jgi:preprotein translocase subunit SecY
MNKYLKEFLHRGLMFGGFGPIVAAIVFFILELTLENFSITGTQIFAAVLSTYLLAFVHAGASVFNQIEHWPLAKSLGFHFLTLFVAYSLCYVANSWIPFDPMVILIFTVIFVVAYLIIWVTVYLIVRATAKNLSKKVKTQ